MSAAPHPRWLFRHVLIYASAPRSTAAALPIYLCSRGFCRCYYCLVADAVCWWCGLTLPTARFGFGGWLLFDKHRHNACASHFSTFAALPFAAVCQRALHLLLCVWLRGGYLLPYRGLRTYHGRGTSRGTHCLCWLLRTGLYAVFFFPTLCGGWFASVCCAAYLFADRRLV